MTHRRLNIGGWLLRVFAWDGLVPVAMLLLSWGLALVDAGGNEWIDFLPVALPIVAIFVRLALGIQTISANHCSAQQRQAQLFLLVFGLVLLAVIECMLMLAPTLPPGMGPFDEPGGLQIVGWILLAYFCFVTVAMYPGRESITTDDPKGIDTKRNPSSPSESR